VLAGFFGLERQQNVKQMAAGIGNWVTIFGQVIAN